MAKTFVAIPDVPQSLNEYERRFFSSIKENLELLLGHRGDRDNIALTRGDVQTDYPPDLTHTGSHYILASGEDVPANADYVQALNEITYIQKALNDLLSRLK